jgi:RNA polymerase sigma-70 factor, ECF subfamily
MELERVKLTEGLRGGDPEFLEGLIETYQHRLFRYALSRTGNRAAAEDIFQETWIRVLERGHQYRVEWKFEVWLFRIARNLVIDLSRRKKSESLDDLMEPGTGSGFQPASSGPSPFQDVLTVEDRDRMAAMLSRIPAIYREVLTLRFHEDLELNEIASVITIPLATVKSRLYRGLDALRQEFERGQA